VNIPLNRNSTQPIYKQISNYLGHLIKAGKLEQGQKLPSIRQLSSRLQINKLTVIQAYSFLESDGLIYARQGAGYFVEYKTSKEIKSTKLKLISNFAPVQEVIISSGGSSFFEQYTASLQAQYHKVIIDFSSGFPRNHNIGNLQKITKRAIAKSFDSLFRYDFPEGQLILRQQITKVLIQQGLEVYPEEIIITNGSEQAISLATSYYLQPHDWVIVETPTYHGALGILENLQVKVIGIPMTIAGMNLELLEKYFKSHRPKLIYTISTLHNPTGITTSVTHRQKLLKLAEEYECQILEDNAYEGLNFEPIPPPIKALDTNNLVTYIGTFSKTIFPGLRAGYMVVTGGKYQELVKQKALNDMHVSTVSQAIVTEYLASGKFQVHLTKLCRENLLSRNIMLQAMESYFPKSITWTIPKGGLFLWVHFPDNFPIKALCYQALSQNVLIADGSAFFPGKGYPAIRLNFSQASENIEVGIKVLGQLIQEFGL
jgi:DNA-binding transcriptional MocR family regulator